MPGLADIVGQERAIELLAGALARGTVHHAYLFEGPEGVGKRTTARAFAEAANCEERPGLGCGACDSCRKIESELHPDVKWFQVLPEKGQTERVRELISQLGFPPHEGRRRVVVMDPADELNDTASNVLLKTLEEPPARTHFVLVTARPASLLVTIRSRCQRVPFLPLGEEAIVARLATEGHADEVARDAAALSQGSMGRALQLVSSEEFPKRRAAVKKLLVAARARKPAAALETASEVAGDREEVLAILEMMWVTYRDALVVAGGRDAQLGGAAPAGSRRDEARWLADAVPEVGLLAGIRAVHEATEAIQGNTSPQLALEALLLGLGRARAA